MTHRYVGIKEVTAWPQEKDGKAGYGVKYADGYTSWSPAEVFEESYKTSEPRMDQALGFAEAMWYLLQDRPVARADWFGEMHLSTAMAVNEDGQKEKSIVAVEYGQVQGQWNCGSEDMLANDWMVLA